MWSVSMKGIGNHKSFQVQRVKASAQQLCLMWALMLKLPQFSYRNFDVKWKSNIQQSVCVSFNAPAVTFRNVFHCSSVFLKLQNSGFCV